MEVVTCSNKSEKVDQSNEMGPCSTPVKDDQFWSEIDVDVVHSEQTDKEQDGIESKDCSGDHEGFGKLFQCGTCHCKEKDKSVKDVVDIVVVGDQLPKELVRRLYQDLSQLVQHIDHDPGVQHKFRVLGSPGEVENGHIGVEEEEDKIGAHVPDELHHRRFVEDKHLLKA